MTELCELYRISRKTGYKWLGRYEADGPAGLASRSSAPLVHGRSTPTNLAEAIVALRQERPTWGPRKLIAKLSSSHSDIVWPAPSTAGELLKRAGLVCGRRLKRRAPPRLGALTVAKGANEVWAVDHKGWVRLGDRTRAEPLTMTDMFSRYVISVTATSSTSQAEAKPLFERAFAAYGLPEVIRSDNGSPFASTGVSGLTTLSAWFIKLGIRHERIDPGSPQQNGSHERFHRTLLEAMQPVCADLAAQARRFEAFARDFNEERPHEALGQKTPASVYVGSPRPLPDRLPEPDYPAAATVRQVRSNGEIKWQGGLVHVCSALAGEAVAVEETEAGEWQVRFFALPIGVIDAKAGKLRRTVAPVHGGDGAAQPAIT